MFEYNHFQLLKEYILEDPFVYARMVFNSAIIGLIEFFSIITLAPVISLFLGEPVTNMSDFIVQLTASIDPIVIVFLFLFMILLQSFMSIANESYFVTAMARWRSDLSLEYISSIMSADFSHYKNLHPGEIEVMITRNIGFAMKIRHRTAVFLTDNVLAVFYIGIALYVSVYSCFLFLGIAIIYLLINRFTLRLRIAYSAIAKQKYILSAQHISEYFADIRSLLSYSKHLFINKVGNELADAAAAQRSTDKINVFIQHIHQPVMLILIFSAVAALKFWLELDNATILLMLYVFYRSAPKLIQVAKGYGEIVGDSPADVTPEIKKWINYARPLSSSLASNVECSIKISHGRLFVDDGLLIDQVNLILPDRSMSVIVGKSGSGKSMLLDVLCGFKQLSCGDIWVGGINGKEINFPEFLWRHVSLVKPESVIISGTIAENIAYLYEDIDRNRVKLLVKTLKLTEFLDERGGIDAYIDARGSNLSAGQRQRIVLARALYKNPGLLLLDEPTSNLDKATEIDIIDVIKGLIGKMTIIIISHNEELLELADHKIRIDNRQLIIS